MKKIKNLFTLFLFGGLVLAFSCEKEAYMDDANDNSTRNEIDEEADNEQIDTEPIDSSMYDGYDTDRMLFDYDVEISSSGGSIILEAQIEEWGLDRYVYCSKGYYVYNPDKETPGGVDSYNLAGRWEGWELIEYSVEYVKVERISGTQIEVTFEPNPSSSPRRLVLTVQQCNYFKGITVTQN